MGSNPGMSDSKVLVLFSRTVFIILSKEAKVQKVLLGTSVWMKLFSLFAGRFFYQRLVEFMARYF